MATKNYSLIFPAVKENFYLKMKLYDVATSVKIIQFGNETDCALSLYDLHDGKILYLLTQHLHWNGYHHPYLVFTSHFGEDIDDKSHICAWLSNQEHTHFCVVIIIYRQKKRIA